MAIPTMHIKIVYKYLEYPVELSTNLSILDFKGYVQQRWGIFTFHQSLKHNGQWLKNDMRVSDYQMMEGDKVYVYEGFPVTITSPSHYIELVVKNNCSVRELKERIHSVIGIAVGAFILHAGDKKMDDDLAILWTYGVDEGSEIKLTFDIGI